MIKKHFLLLTMLFVGSLAFGQFGITLGPSLLRPFGANKSFFGMHIGGEYSIDDASTYFGRITVYGNQKDSITRLASIQEINGGAFSVADYSLKGNYTVISGGARYYVGDGYETGFSAYGGTTLNLVFNSVKAEFRDLDETKYVLSTGYFKKGTAFGAGVGLQGGVKYGIEYLGTVYFDLGLDYMLLYQAGNALAADFSYLSPLLFHFNIGFRKDIGGF